MRSELFLQIINSVCKFDPWFVQRQDSLYKLGLSSLQKCIVALKMLAYGILVDEYYRLGEATAFEAMKQFIIAICGCFEGTL